MPCSPETDPPSSSGEREQLVAAALRARRARLAVAASSRNVECRLPSPAWPQLQASSPCRAPISSVPSTASASRSSGTTTSSLSLPPRCAVTAIETPSRQRHSAAIPLGAVEARHAQARPRPAPRPARRAGASASAADPSASASTMKPAPVGMPPGKAARRQRDRRRASRYSSAATCRPLPSTASIAAQPAADVGVERRHRERRLRRGDQPQPGRRDDPERPLRADQQARSGRSRRRPCASAPPTEISSPGGTTASRPVTHAPVTPYLNACGPPALVAMLPPICDCSAAPGSGGKQQAALAREPAHARRSARRPRPGSATAADRTRASRAMRSRSSTTPPADRHRAAREPGAAAARHDRHLVLVAPGHHRRHLLGVAGKHHGVGNALQPGRLGGVGAVQRGRRVEHRVRPNDRGQVIGESAHGARTIPTLKLATWNVNSIKMRLPRVLEFLEQHRPDVLCMQETKSESAAFPHAELAEAGYAAVDQSAGRWAGVAIAAPVEHPLTGMTTASPARPSPTRPAGSRRMSPACASAAPTYPTAASSVPRPSRPS